MAPAEAFWAYGVVAATWSPAASLRGVDGSRVEAIRHARVAVLASAVPAGTVCPEALERRLNDLETLAALARAHDRVLQAALPTTDVVPFRICTLFASRAGVVQMVHEQAEHFESALARLHG